MNSRTELANGLAYQFVPDTSSVEADRMRAVLHARMLDELTGLPMASRMMIDHTHTALKPRVSGDGIAGLMGNPGRLFPHIGGTAVDLEMTVRAERFVPRRLNASLGPVVGFPNAFSPIDFGDVPMHRVATAVKGRVVQINGADRIPLDAADVQIQGVWPTFPPANVDPIDVIQVPNLVALSSGLYADRVATVDQVRRRVIGIVFGEEKTLLRSASAGQRRLQVSDRVNLNVGDLLAIQTNHVELAEYIVIADIDGASTADQAATITLNYPLQHSHPRAITVVRATLQAQAADNPLSRTGIPGDQSIFCDTLNGLADGSVIEITGSDDPEYHRMRRYHVTTDAEGYFRLPPIARVAQLRLEADRADLLAPHILDFSPNYDVAEQRLDILVQ